MSEAPPPGCQVAFKEWSGVCDALASGRQALILRKGGIAEDDGRFTPEHPAFWLYPTRLHESQQGLRVEPPDRSGAADPAIVPIRSLAVVAAVHHIDREADLAALEPFHVWTEETVRTRFHYRSPGLWALTVRVWSLPVPIEWVASPAEAGCKTWVHLDRPLSSAGASPALPDPAWDELQARMHRAFGSHRAPRELE